MAGTPCSQVAVGCGEASIVGLTLVPGASVAHVARAHGVNANQVFKWRSTLNGASFGAGFSIRVFASGTAVWGR